MARNQAERPGEDGDGRLILAGGRVLDSETMAFSDRTTVEFQGDRVTRLSEGMPALPRDDGDVVVDATGLYVLPGLVDSHFHLVSRSATEVDEDLVAVSVIEGVLSARERLLAGVTTVRDAGCRHRGIHALVTALRAGLIAGPRAFVAGRNPAGPGAPRHWRNVFVDGPEQTRQAVRAELDAGADWVKFIISHAEDPTQWGSVTRYLGPEEIEAGVEEAHSRGVRTGAHCEGYDEAAMAIQCGIDTLDHAPLLDEGTAALMFERGAVYVPTLWAFSADAGLDLAALPPASLASLHRWRAEHIRSVQRAHAAGVLIAAGTDAAASIPPRDVLLREMRALAAAGLTNADVLAAATRNGAVAVGAADRIGRLAIGMAADAIVVRGNPLDSLGNLSDPLLVVAAGRVVVNRLTDHGMRLDDPPDPAGEGLFSVTVRWEGA